MIHAYLPWYVYLDSLLHIHQKQLFDQLYAHKQCLHVPWPLNQSHIDHHVKCVISNLFDFLFEFISHELSNALVWEDRLVLATHAVLEYLHAFVLSDNLLDLIDSGLCFNLLTPLSFLFLFVFEALFLLLFVIYTFRLASVLLVFTKGVLIWSFNEDSVRSLKSMLERTKLLLVSDSLDRLFSYIELQVRIFIVFEKFF